MNDKEMWGWAKLGAIAGVATGFFLKTVSQLVSMIPGVSLDLQSISISTTGLGNVVNTGLSTYAKKVLGMVPVPLTMPEWVWLAVGGALFMIVGAYAAEMVGIKGSKQSKLTWTFVLAGLATGAIMSWTLAIPTLSALWLMVVDAFLLSWLILLVDQKGRLVP